MGGWISLNFASQYSDRVRRLILLDSAGMKFTPSFDLRLLSPHTIAEMQGLEKVMTPYPERTPAFITRDFLHRLRSEDWVIQRTVTNMITMRAGCQSRASQSNLRRGGQNCRSRADRARNRTPRMPAAEATACKTP